MAPSQPDSKVQRILNGATTKWVVTVSTLLIGVFMTAGISFTMGRLDSVAQAMDDHGDLPGHPLTVAEVAHINEFGRKIEEMVGELGKAVGANHDALIEQRVILNQINATVNGGA